MDISKVIVAALIGYVFGNVQTAYILGKLVRHIDIREYGSTNAGASNATIVLGWKYGVITAVNDAVKAFLAVVLIHALYPTLPDLAFIAGGSAVLGHIFPAFMKFRGGKGIASLVGMFYGLNFLLGLALTLLIIVATFALDYIAIVSIALYVALPFFAAFVFDCGPLALALSVVLAAIGIYKHLSNIKKIRAGTEVGLSSLLKRKPAQH